MTDVAWARARELPTAPRSDETGGRYRFGVRLAVGDAVVYPAYGVGRTGNGDIYVMDADGHNKVRLTSSAASDIDPSWEPQ